MPAVSGDYDPDIGILLQVEVRAGGTIRAAAGGNGAESGPLAVPDEAHGLIDTGASKTAISPRLVRKLGLQPTGRTEIRSAAGTTVADTHAVDLVLRFGRYSAAIENLEVCEIDLGTAPFDVIVGRDVLCQGVLTMDFAGRFTFSV